MKVYLRAHHYQTIFMRPFHFPFHNIFIPNPARKEIVPWLLFSLTVDRFHRTLRHNGPPVTRILRHPAAEPAPDISLLPSSPVRHLHPCCATYVPCVTPRLRAP